jgi:putative ABC transport system permease protein
LFALGVSVLTGILFGVVPAWMTSRAEPVDALRGANRSVGGRRHWAQKTLVIAQVAVSLVLLSAAAMLGGSLRNLQHQDFGFATDGRSLVSIDPTLSNYKQEKLNPLFREIHDRLSAIPGVRQVSAATYAPLSGSQWGHSVFVEGRPEPGPKDDIFTDWTRITPGFFDTIGVRMLAGRSITEDDNASTRPVAVVNEAFARKFFGKQNPIGQHFGPEAQRNAGTYEIVGVVSDVHWVDWDFKEPDRAMYYIAEAQTVNFRQQSAESYEIWSQNLASIVLWAPGNPPNLAAQVKRVLADVDPTLVLQDVQPYSVVVHDVFTQENTIASLTWLFGAIGLVLAAIGLYGVTAYGVEQRTSEIGVRMALGADRGQVVQMVLKGAFVQVAIGLALGVPSAIGAGYLIASQLFGVKPWDPLMLGAATVLLALAALVAAVIPAQRAAGLDPVVALRTE